MAKPTRLKHVAAGCLLVVSLVGCGNSESSKYSEQDIKDIRRSDAHNQVNSLEKGYNQMADEYQKRGLIDQKTASEIKSDIKRQSEDARNRVNRY